jgi:NADPH:quinone reductase-like Zn-dependent oxidoreductase
VKAIGLMQFGGPEVLQQLTLPEREPGPGQVRIRVRAAAVSPTDTLLRAGYRSDRLAGLAPPYIPGMDAAGVIDAVGPDVTGWRAGQDVMAVVIPQRPEGGAYAEQLVVPADWVARMPAGASYAEASTLPMNGLTARATLDRLALSPGEVLAVTGAAGAYGGYLIALARADGLEVIADSAEQDEELVRSFGAHHIVRRGKDVADRILDLRPDGVDAVADGALLDGLIVPAIKPGGQLAVVRGWHGEADRGITVHSIRVHQHVAESAHHDELRQLAEDGVLALRVAGSYPAGDAAEAHRRFEAGGVRGRLVLTFG